MTTKSVILLFARTMWLLLLFSLSLARNVTLFDKSTSSPIENLGNWTPDTQSCVRVVDSNFNLITAKIHFPQSDIRIEVLGDSDYYLLTHGKLIHYNSYRELVLLRNVSFMTVDRVQRRLYWVRGRSLYSWNGFKAVFPQDIIDVEVTDGEVVVVLKNRTVLLNNDPLMESDRICFYPRANSILESVNKLEQYSELLLSLLFLLCFFPCYICARAYTSSKVIESSVTSDETEKDESLDFGEHCYGAAT